MSSIAIIGASGSGKTVFVTSLARYLGTLPNASGAFMEPLTLATQRYVEQAGAALDGGTWPPSTPPGTLVDLRWQIIWPNRSTTPLRVLDAAGQDMRQLFGIEGVAHVEDMPKQLQEIAATAKDADIILLTVNLGDFIADQDKDRQLENQWTIKFAVDWLKAAGPGKSFGLIFTQVDLYEAEIRSCDGDFLEVARRFLPVMHGAHLQQRDVWVHGISCVSQTVPAVETNGFVRRVPARGYTHCGLEAVVIWLGQRITRIAENVIAATGSGSMRSGDSASAARPVRPSPSSPAALAWLAGVSTMVMGACLLTTCAYQFFKPASTPPPVPTFATSINPGNWLDDISVTNTSDIPATHVYLKITGAATNSGGWDFLDAYDKKTWFNAFNHVSNIHDVHVQVFCDQFHNKFQWANP